MFSGRDRIAKWCVHDNDTASGCGFQVNIVDANTGPTNAITVTYLIPLFAMLLGAVVINEPITGSMLIGCAVILLGTALATGLLRLPAASRR